MPEVEVLGAEFLENQRARLRAARDEVAEIVEGLIAEMNGLMARRREMGGSDEGFGGVDTTSVDVDRARSQYTVALNRLSDIDAALARLDAGTYGRCLDCGGPIGRARLEAIPDAARCVVCQARPRRLRRGLA